MGKKTERTFRIVHRYLGFFLAGIMIVYAISGIVLLDVQAHDLHF